MITAAFSFSIRRHRQLECLSAFKVTETSATWQLDAELNLAGQTQDGPPYGEAMLNIRGE
jgi:hypothetical protein